VAFAGVQHVEGALVRVAEHGHLGWEVGFVDHREAVLPRTASSGCEQVLFCLFRTLDPVLQSPVCQSRVVQVRPGPVPVAGETR
jgi:hypothetical protein